MADNTHTADGSNPWVTVDAIADPGNAVMRSTAGTTTTITDAVHHFTTDTIEKRGDKYVLLSSEGEVLGEHDTEELAKAQEQAIASAKARSRTADSEDWAYTFDFAPITKRSKVDSRDANGFLRVAATVTAPGVYAYIRNGSVRNELKPAAEIFAHTHMASVHGAVVTDEHPPNATAVTPENSQEFQRGHSISPPVATPTGMDVDLVVTDGALIEDAESGRKTGVSLGMRNTFEHTPGVWTADDGSKHPYDVIQRNMVTNHIAIVSEPRVTSAQLHLDSLAQDGTQDNTMEPKKATLTIDGAGFEIDANVASIVNAAMGRQKMAFEALQAKFDEATSSYDSLTVEKDKMTAERDAALAERDTAKEQIASTDALDVNELVTKRLAFLDKARQVLTSDKFEEVKGKTDMEIMRFTCDSCNVDLADKSEAYIEARFDGLVDASEKTNDSGFIRHMVNPGEAPGQAAHRKDINTRLEAYFSGKAAN